MKIKVPFTEDEIRCRCGCGLLIVRDQFIAKLSAARHIAGVPFIPTSWVRCPDHNQEVGGAEDSAHLTGYAVDLAIQDNEIRSRVLGGISAVFGMARLGVGKDFLHVDDRPGAPRPRVWVY